MRKKVFIAMLAGTMSISLLGCGSSDKVDTAEETEIVQELETTDANEAQTDEAADIEEETSEENSEEDSTVADDESAASDEEANTEASDDTSSDQKSESQSNGYIYSSAASDVAYVTGVYVADNGTDSFFMGFSTGEDERDCKYDFDDADISGTSLGEDHYRLETSDSSIYVFTISGTNYVISFKLNESTQLYDAYLYSGSDNIAHFTQQAHMVGG